MSLTYLIYKGVFFLCSKNKEETTLTYFADKLASALLSMKMNKNVLGVRMDGFTGMTKREQELRQSAADLKAEAEKLMDGDKVEEAKAKLTEAKAAKKNLDDFLALQADFKGLGTPPEPNQAKAGIQTLADPEPVSVEAYKSVFLKALRGKKLTEAEANVMQDFKAGLSQGTGEDGGYIVPEDITTAINELRNTEDSLEQYVTVEAVKTNKGARTLEKRADSTPFAPLSEYGDPNAMAEMSSPKFDRLEYVIDDYAGFLPVPNDLLADTDQALEQYLRRWIAKKSKATRNSLILAAIATLAKVSFADYKEIKTALNVTLDPAFSVVAKVFTNQDGFNFLDQIEVADGRPLLQPDPTNATKKLLYGRPIVVLANKTIATTVTGLVPIIIGELKEAVVLWDRQQLSVDMTKEGGNAWRTNTTEFRAIEREDVTLWDDEAVVYGQLDITPGV